ncbi:MAG TPA: hypothetical protein PKN44_16000, partial [Bacteroidales bacterium]|nr:hypothetical protein [Bacteroidales bacterium]
ILTTNEGPEMIFLGSELRAATPDYKPGHVFILDKNGDSIAGWSYTNPAHRVILTRTDVEARMPAPVVGDVNGDGLPEIFLAGHHTVYGWNANGDALANFPITCDSLETTLIAPLLADIDGDDDIEIIVASNDENAGGIYAFHIDSGLPVTGWPLRIGPVEATPSIDDLDFDGKSELIAAAGPSVHVFNTPGNASRIIWGKYRLNTLNNAVYSQPCAYSATPMILNTEETWYNDRRLNSDLVIEPGGKLTLKGTVYMPLEAKIIVEAGDDITGGGALIIDGGKITTDCPGLWKGIEVWGVPKRPQSDVDTSNHLVQGQVRLLHGGAILNAVTAILASKSAENPNEEHPYGYAGGIVTADSAWFVNNQTAVHFDPYT